MHLIHIGRKCNAMVVNKKNTNNINVIIIIIKVKNKKNINNRKTVHLNEEPNN